MDFAQIGEMMKRKKGTHPYPQHLKDSRRIATEGMVLLKNENGVLPLKSEKAALFGAGAVDTITCGTGSGYVSAPYVISVREGLENAGITVTSSAWLDRFAEASKKANDEDKTLNMMSRLWSGLSILIDEIPVTAEDIAAASDADTAIYVLRRNAGEGGDRRAVKGDYYLSDVERSNIEAVAAAFKHTVILLNTCVIDANFINEIPGIDGALLISLGGGDTGSAAADILTGKVSPSGHLTDTWAKRYEDNPASAAFGANDGDILQEDYVEDIFVGYRYFDTFGIEPLFPFGYGLSYTTFDRELVKAEADWCSVRLTVKVTNTGSAAGRDVVQVYVTAPEGRLTKPYQELKGFAKTEELAPGADQTLTIEIAAESLSSFDESCCSYVMEKGDYIIRIGEHSRKTEALAVLSLDEDAVLRKVRDVLHPDHELNTLKAPARSAESVSPLFCLSLKAADCVTADDTCNVVPSDYDGTSGNLPAAGAAAIAKDQATLIDVAEGRVSMKDFVDSLDEEVLLRFVAGAADETPYEIPSRVSEKTVLKDLNRMSSSGATTAMFRDSLAVPAWKVTDGPAGCHLPLCEVTSYPVGLLIAQTWDRSLANLSGLGIGKELAAFDFSVILGPGMNIHRDPLCGRSFEYFSEDPLLSGEMAAEITLGVQATPGTGVSIKHFACNNQEEDRLHQNSTVSVRALREIYLKGFEICVRKADPKTVMTSYNLINGVHTSSRKDLLTDVLRGEWGFKGLVMTDWGTQSVKAYDLAAGNDLIMGGYRSDFLKAAVHGKQPEFTEDGYVRTQEFQVYGGFFTNVVEFWNVFEPDAAGADVVETSVSAGTELNPLVQKKVEEGIASIQQNADCSCTVSYRGTNRGQYLSMKDVKQCAARTFAQIINSVSYRVMTSNN
ncbi:MAG: glycoside hydrolase family 3 C-terminal domain-containing protein [Lachnospiraceae bacterium]|nr:glycoside hydrolase family 3 C-terminal domain-containing protein [Lachnospiraceae bacterium]